MRRGRQQCRRTSCEPLEERRLLTGLPPTVDTTSNHALGDHVHGHISILINGTSTPLPANVGVPAAGTPSFIHSHDASGIVHIHPVSGNNPDHFITVGDFFTAWRTNSGAGNNASANYSPTQIMGNVADATRDIRMYVNGVESSEFQTHIIEDGEDIVITYGSFVTLAPIAAVTLLAGAPLQIPLAGFDSELDALTFSIQSTNGAITGTTNAANRSLRLAVEHDGGTEADTFAGAMTFELFEDRAPRTAARIIQLAQSGFYDDLTFHRVINNFMIQGGDPLGTGTGGSGTEFDDEFTPLLQHTSTGLLSMAKSSDDTNDSQFFVTEGPTRHLDFNHSILGRLTTGEAVREAISNVPTGAANKPSSPVTITSATVYLDTQNRVLSLSAPIGATGSGDVTVTVYDGKGHQTQRTFQVTIAPDTTNNRPIFLYDAPFFLQYNGTVNFQLASLDLEGSPIFYDKAPVDEDLTLTFDSTTGAGTLTAKNNFIGVNSVYIAVRATTNDGTGIDQFDGQSLPVLVLPPAPTSIDLVAASDTGSSSTDNITGRNNLNAESKLQFVIGGVFSGTEVTLYDGATLIGTATATGSTVTVTTNGSVQLSLGQHNLTARQTLKNQSLGTVGNSTTVLDLPSPLSATQTLTIVSDWKNPLRPLDVNNDTLINALDVLLVVNNINLFGQHALGAAPTSGAYSFIDVNGDATVSSLDVLLIVNHINGAFASSLPQSAAPLFQAASPVSQVAALSAVEATDTPGEATSPTLEVPSCAAHQAIDAALQSQATHGWSADNHDLWSLLASDTLYGRKSGRRSR